MYVSQNTVSHTEGKAMAVVMKSESYSNAVIDANDMTITEYVDDAICIYDIEELLKRWSGIPNITLSISYNALLTTDRRDNS